MNKKIIIQLFLFLLLLSIAAFTFFFYFNKKENLIKNDGSTEKSINASIDEETSSLIKDIRYVFTDAKGNNYEILSKFGKIDIKNADKIFMTNVIANIYLIDSSPIKIVSEFAYYNKNNHETNFFEDVVATYEEHIATSENLDLLFTRDLAIMYNDIIYNKPGTKLTADRLEIDLITKNSKIFMDNTSEKVQIIDKR